MRMQTYSLLAGIAALFLMNGRLTARAADTQQPGVSVAPAPLLTLRKALDIALQNNRRITISGLQVEQARQRVAQAQIDLLPQLNVQAGGGELLDRVKVHFPSGVLGTVNGSPVPSQDIDITTRDRFTTAYSLTLAQPLTQIPRIQTGIRLLKTGADIAREQQRDQRQTITGNVRETYFVILQTQEGIKATNQSLKALQELERTVADSVVQQSALRADLLEIQARVAAQEATLSELLDTLQQYKEQMNVLLGRDVQTPFQVAPETEETLPETDLDRLQAQALRDRPDLRRSALQIRQAELDRRSTRLGYVPDLSLAIQYAGLGSDINGLPDHTLTAGFLFTWKEPFDWGRRRHEIVEKTRAIEQAHLAYQEAQASAQVDINHHLRREHLTRDQQKAAQAQQTAARERLRVVLDQYQTKTALLKDVLQAQAALAEADRQVQDTGLTYLIAQSELRKALGEE
jgi:outer membrane protein